MTHPMVTKGFSNKYSISNLYFPLPLCLSFVSSSFLFIYFIICISISSSISFTNPSFLFLNSHNKQDQDQFTQFCKMNMNRVEQQVIRFPTVKTTPVGYLPDPASINKYRVSTSSKKSEQSNGKSIFRRKKTDGFTNGARDQNRLVKHKLTETVKRKLSLGARILQVGGLEKIYKRLFRVNEDEKLFKTYQCYLSTTEGPIAGLLFISSKKMAFCSERSIKVASPQGDTIRVHYKVSIPLSKIKRVNQSQNTKKPSQKYLEVVTVDGFDFWFMGFLSYQKAFNCLQQALSLSFEDDDSQ